MPKWIACFVGWLLIFLVSSAKALPADEVFISDLKGYTYFFDISQASILAAPKSSGIDEIAKKQFSVNKRNLNFNTDSAYWIKLKLYNNTNNTKEYFIYSNGNDYTELYKYNPVANKLLGKAGFFVPTSQLQLKDISFYLKFKINPQEHLTLFVKVYNKRTYIPDLNLSLEDEATFSKEMYKHYQYILPSTFVSVLFIGSLSFIFFFMLFLYFKSYQKIYLYYALYLLGSILYAFTRLNNVTWVGKLIDYFPLMREYLSEPIQFMFFAVYNFFVIELLDIDFHDKRLSKTLRWLAWIYLVYALIHLLMMLLLFDYTIKNNLFIITRIILFPLNIGLVIWAYLKVKSPVLTYFLVGITFYITAGLFAALVDFRVQLFDYTELGLMPINIFQIGIMAEVLCFSLAIGYRIKLNEDDKKRNQQALINQLQINQKLVENANEKLEKEISIRSKKLVEISKEMEAKNLSAMKLSYEKKLAEAEMLALRSQMNPHFIFNSLNSVRYFMLSNQNDKAVSYLNKFSRLMRLVLENSNSEVISLEQELEALDLYLRIEANRFNDQFHYEINIQDGLETSDISIPPLLLQPFAENAIWHGLLQSDEPYKKIIVDILQPENQSYQYSIQISDNGIGREKAAEFKTYQSKGKKSFGISLTQERIKLFNENAKYFINYEVDDITANNQIKGTIVTFTFTLKNESSIN